MGNKGKYFRHYIYIIGEDICTLTGPRSLFSARVFEIGLHSMAKFNIARNEWFYYNKNTIKLIESLKNSSENIVTSEWEK